MCALTLLNDRIVHCTACSRLVTYRETIAIEKRKQFEDWTYWGRPVPGFGDSHARLYVLGLAPAAMAATEPDEYSLAIVAGTGCMTPYIDWLRQPIPLSSPG